MSTFSKPVVDVLWGLPEDEAVALIRVHQTQHNDRRTRKRHVTLVLTIEEARELIETLQTRVARAEKGPARP
jgi:hypothetical protein